MYSTKVIESSVGRIEAAHSLKLTRYTVDEAAQMTDHLAKLIDPSTGELRRKSGQLTRDENSFIKNERLLTMVDFLYWASRYGWFIPDQGGLSRFTPWESQRIILDVIARFEEEMMDAYLRGEPVDGILIAIHKARQLGATQLWRLLIMHRVTTGKYQRAITASVDAEDKIQKIYERDKRILDNLPWWLRPSVGYDEKRQHILFDRLDSSVTYQEYVQKSGLAQGEQWDVGHMTECAEHPNPREFEHNYWPAIPQSPYALHGMESTAQGRGNWWHKFVQDTRKGGTRWKFCFIPYYVEKQKYNRQPPPDWKPSEISMLHAQRVHETSAEWCGKPIMLSKTKLYWWETTREEYQRNGVLNLFLTNFCATLEESFQHTSQAAFSSEMLDELRSHAHPGVPYEIRVGAM